MSNTLILQKVNLFERDLIIYQVDFIWPEMNK